MYKVKRMWFGWFHRAHGILLENLPYTKRKMLIENRYFKWFPPDTQFYEIIFKIEDNINIVKSRYKTYWNPYIEDFTTMKQLIKDSDLVDWNCAICNDDIKSRMGEKRVENYVCSDCSVSHNSKNELVDKRIITASVEFTKHCKKYLIKKQRSFLKYIKKSVNS